MATRYSWSLTSFGMPTFTRPTLDPGSAADEPTGVSQEHRVDQRRVRQPAVEHALQQVRERHPHEDHVRLLVRGLEVAAVGRLQLPGQVEMDDLRGDAGRAVRRAEVGPGGRPVA